MLVTFIFSEARNKPVSMTSFADFYNNSGMSAGQCPKLLMQPIASSWGNQTNMRTVRAVAPLKVSQAYPSTSGNSTPFVQNPVKGEAHGTRLKTGGVGTGGVGLTGILT